MKRLIACAALLLAGCDSGWTPPVVNGGSRAIPLETAQVASGEQFPRVLYRRSTQCALEDVIPWQPILDEFRQEWFSSHLNAAGEQPLPRIVGRAEPALLSLRFLWLPTFHNPVVIRIETAADGDARMVAKRLSGAGGYDPGTVAAQLERALTKREWQRIARELTESQLFVQPAGDCSLGFDGSEWIIEAVDESGYRFFRRWSPEDGPVRELGDLLLDLTGWQFEEVY